MSTAPTVSENNKRIAKNTLMLYVKMAFTMGISLFTSRIILEALGVVDYGIYNVVGGFVALFAILSGALSVSISRFFAFELGRENKDKLQKIFSSAIIIQAVIGFVVILAVSTFGIWFVENKLVIPPARLNAAAVVLLCSGVSFFVGLISVPYNAAIIAHERMKAFAYVGILEALLRLGIAYALLVIAVDSLILYGVLTLAVAIAIRFIYAIYCKKHFEECRFTFAWDNHLLKKMFSFAGWAFLGNGSFVLKMQGVNVVINMFCGPAVNAAAGVASQVTAAVSSFVSNFMQAVNPQITKNFSSGNLQKMRTLIHRSSRFSFYLMLFLCLPVMKNTEYILSIWLVDVPVHAAIFIQLTFIFYLIDCLVTPVMFGLLAEGNIRNYEIFLAVVNTANLPLSYLVLLMGYPPESVFVIAIGIGVCVAAGRVWYARKAFGLSARGFTKEVLINVTMVGGIACCVGFFLNVPTEHPFLKFVVESGLLACVTGGLVLFLGLQREERKFLVDKVCGKLKGAKRV